MRAQCSGMRVGRMGRRMHALCAHAYAHGKAARPGDSSDALVAYVRAHTVQWDGMRRRPGATHTRAHTHACTRQPVHHPCLSFPRPDMACTREGRITTAMQGGRFKVYDACAGHPDHRPVSSVSTSPSPPRAHTRWTHILHTRRTYTHTYACTRQPVHHPACPSPVQIWHAHARGASPPQCKAGASRCTTRAPDTQTIDL
jgi:hypothetical protein